MVPDSLSLLSGKFSIPLGTNKAKSRAVTTFTVSKERNKENVRHYLTNNL